MSDLSLRYLLFGEDRSASKTIQGVGDTANTTAGRVGSAMSGVGSQIGGEFGAIFAQIGDGLASVGDHGAKMGAKLMAGGGIVTGLGVALQSVGSAEEQAQSQLAAAIKASGEDFDAYQGKIGDAIKAQENFGHSAADTQAALQKITQATNDPQKALSEMGLVADLAAAKHVSLADAASTVAKILSGGGQRALKEFGITMAKNKDGTVDAAGALDALGKKLDGQADASVDNFSAKVDIVKTKLGDWTSSMGEKVGPALTAIGPVLLGVGALVESGALGWVRNTAATVANAAAGLVVKGVILAQQAAIVIVTAAQWLWNAALTANPIGLVIIAVAAFIAALVLLWQHSETFRAIVTATWTAVKDAVMTVVGWFTGTAWPAIQRFGDAIAGMFSNIPGMIRSAFSGLVNIITAPYRMAFNLIADLWNNTVGRLSFSLPSWIPGMGGKGFSMPQLPHMAMGGIVTSPTIALIGEAGPEAVVPLNRSGASGFGTTVNVYVSGDTDPLGAARRIAAIMQQGRQNGLAF